MKIFDLTNPMLGFAFALTAVLGSPMVANADTAKATPGPTVFSIQTRKSTKTKLNEWLKMSSYMSFRAIREQDIRRDDRATDITDEHAFFLGLALRADLKNDVTAFLHAELYGRDKATQLRTYARIAEPRIKEALLSFPLSEKSTLSIGRLRFSDRNKWVADASVDGLHYGTTWNKTSLELALVKGTLDNHSEYAIGHVSQTNDKKTFGAFVIGETNSGARRFHVSAYFNHKLSKNFEYQANVAGVFGDAANGHSEGLGLDFRATRKFENRKWNPQLTLGFAAGSKGFQQTGLNSNKTYDGGQTQFDRYGYLYQPDLTNMMVATLSYGVRPSRNFSMDLTLHAYAQPSASTIAPSARLRGATTGLSNYLGSEVSITGAWRPTRKTKVEFGLAKFTPGSAYVDRSNASRIYGRVSYYF